MPRILRTVIPRIRRSLEEKGVVVTALRAALLPIRLFQEYRLARKLVRDSRPSEFDLTYHVETEGDFDGWTFLSDLDVRSPNWISATNYIAIGPDRFLFSLSSLQIPFENFVFIDFGSGKGRALLMASELPFKRIIGVEFSSELHATAQRNLLTFHSPTQKCKTIESICMDVVDFPLPLEPSVLFFYDPCSDKVLAQVLQNLENSLRTNPRQIYLIYVAPSKNRFALLNSSRVLKCLEVSEQYNFYVYKAV